MPPIALIYAMLVCMANLSYYQVSTFVYHNTMSGSVLSGIAVQRFQEYRRAHFFAHAQASKTDFETALKNELLHSENEKLYPLLCSLESACKNINVLMRRVALDKTGGYHDDDTNIHGEKQKKLDVIANLVLKTSLCSSSGVGIIASEEDVNPWLCGEVAGNSKCTGEYTVVYDPLDGSSNIESGLPTGTIFGIYKSSFKTESDNLLHASTTQQGNRLLAAGYCIYAAATHLVLTLRRGVQMFTFDDTTGKFYQTRSNIRIPKSGAICSFNDANARNWHCRIQSFVNMLKQGNHSSQGVPSVTPRTVRYMGALVADAHNILLNGGIFGYPGTCDNHDGKLRVVYEANPIALIIEQAGGLATDGRQRILDKPIMCLHQRTPLFIGSEKDVALLQQHLAVHGGSTTS